MSGKRIVLASLASIVRKWRPIQNSDCTLVCPAPVPEANLGDQALMIAVVEELRRRGVGNIVLVATSQHPIETYGTADGLRIVDDLHYVFQTDRCFRERLAWIRLARRSRALIMIGADVLDEGYSRARSAASFWAIRTASKMGVSSRVVGFSVNGAPSTELRVRMLELANTKLFARDPISHERLRRAGIPNVSLAGDLAFLLQPAAWSAVAGDVQEFVREHQGRIIGINLTDVVFDAHRDQVFRKFAKALVELARYDQFRFLLLPHDDQGGREFLRRFHEAVEHEMPGIAKLVDPLPTARQLKAIAGRCLHLFTCRLHLGIATLGMGRPITCFPYQGKFEGQFAHFGLSEDGLIRPETLPTDPAELAQLMRGRIAESDELAARIQNRLPAVRKLALKNFDGIPRAEASVRPDCVL